MARCSRIQNPIGQLQTVTVLSTFAFIVTRHSCRRCVYLMGIAIFAVVACTITSFIITYLLSLILVIFWWLGTFCDHVIFRSTSIAFPRRKFRISVRWNINRVSFLLFLSNPFETFFRRMIITSPKCTLYLNRVCSLTMSNKTWETTVNIYLISLQGRYVQWFLVSKFFLSSQVCLVACYLSWVFSTLMKIFQKCVHKFVFRIAVYCWNWKSMCILKPLNVIDCRFPSFMCNLL